MKLAIPCETEDIHSSVSYSFGRATYFCIYDTNDLKEEFILNGFIDQPGGAGIKVAELLCGLDVGVVITPRMGENAYDVLKQAEIEVVQSIDSSIQENINLYLQNQLKILYDIHEGYHGKQ